MERSITTIRSILACRSIKPAVLLCGFLALFVAAPAAHAAKELLQVFVTPTCPYCPRAVLLAHQMAMENPQMIRAEGVEATEFPELANRFNVRGVPQTVINSGAGSLVGAAPEQNLLAEIQRALLN